jgi:endonuclease III
MSGLTVELRGGKPRRGRSARWQARFGAIADRLVAACGTPALGNFDDPVQEIVYILLSAKTADRGYRKTHAALTARFPTLRALADAPVKQIYRCIRAGGFGNAKAERLRRIARILLAELGEDPSTRLREMSAREVYSFLTALPGVGPKSAFCVMMWSLGFDVFPVDVNVSRIAVRVGAVPAGRKHYHYQVLVPPLIPDGRSRELHSAMVVHGRTVCLPRKPRCDSCPIRDLCDFGMRSLGRSARKRHPSPPDPGRGRSAARNASRSANGVSSRSAILSHPQGPSASCP